MRCPVDGRQGARALSAWPDELQAGAVALYEGEGFGIVRYGFLMVRDLTEPIPDRDLPDSLEIRPVLEDRPPPIWDADVEAFRDHWGRSERTEADYARWFTTGARHRPVAGRLGRRRGRGLRDELRLPRGQREARHKAGLARARHVRRPWRRRGLASALIAESMRALGPPA